MKPIVLKLPGTGFANTAFEVIQPDLFTAGDEATAPFQFAIVPLLGRHDNLEQALEDLTPDQLASAHDGRLGLVLDHSLEAMAHHDQRLDAWHAALARRALPPEHCLVLTQGRLFAEGYASYCDRTGRVRRLHILTYDYLLKRQALSHGADGKAVFEARLKRFQVRPTQRPYLFLSMNHKARPHRLAFLVRLMRHGLLEKGLVSFAGFVHHRQLSAATYERPSPLEGLTDSWLAEGFEPELEGLVARDTLGLPGDLWTVPPHGPDEMETLLTDPDVSYFDTSYFSAVLESEMAHVRRRVTEKALRPFANFHPFVLFGNHGALDMLRDLGFRTFEPLIDEQYDRIVSPQGRFDTAMLQFLRLCRLAEAGRLDLGAIEDAVIHNAEFMLTRFAGSYATTFDVPIAETMTRMTDAAMARLQRRQ